MYSRFQRPGFQIPQAKLSRGVLLIFTIPAQHTKIVRKRSVIQWGQTIDPLSSWLNACKCPLQLSRIRAVILGFRGVKGTNPQIVPPNVYDEQPRLLAFDKRK